ncbi:hypothetical protein, partial [Acinetobacter baumannii]|uniref:hypothetical protein n=1 Tax=Acinetobacter baumannii TaxID=470 RepID=UPI001C44E1C4
MGTWNMKVLCKGFKEPFNFVLTRKHLVVSLKYPLLLYTSDAADDLLCVDLGGRGVITKKKSAERSRRCGTENK